MLQNITCTNILKIPPHSSPYSVRIIKTPNRQHLAETISTRLRSYVTRLRSATLTNAMENTLYSREVRNDS